MRLISLLLTEPLSFFILIIPLMYSVIIHEIAHGAVAYMFGDDTAKRSGRLSLNPVGHIDPIGAVSLLLVGFGWAKPVPVNYYNLRNSRFAVICVSLAGCFANILMAAVAIFLLLFFKERAVASVFVSMLLVFARVNIILGAFNLIPIPPLDGSKVLMSILPSEAQKVLASMESFGFLILIFLLFTGVLEPLIAFFENGIILIISMALHTVSF